jgi:hypothetical protein
MANRNSGHRAGGGLGSRQVVHAKSMKVEPKSQGVRPGFAGQIGAKLGNHVTDRRETVKGAAVPAKTPGYNAPPGTNLNCKPNILACGTQAMHGGVAGTTKPAGQDILSGFGPESAASNERRRG